MKRSKKAADDSQGDTLQSVLRHPRKEQQIFRIDMESPIKLGGLRGRKPGLGPPGLKRAVPRMKLVSFKRPPPTD